MQGPARLKKARFLPGFFLGPARPGTHDCRQCEVERGDDIEHRQRPERNFADRARYQANREARMFVPATRYCKGAAGQARSLIRVPMRSSAILMTMAANSNPAL